MRFPRSSKAELNRSAWLEVELVEAGEALVRPHIAEPIWREERETTDTTTRVGMG